MWSVIPWEWIFGYGVVIILTTLMVVWHFKGRPGWRMPENSGKADKPITTWLGIITTTITCVAFITAALAKWAWTPLMSISFVSERIFTDLNGTWKGQLHSIWPDPKTGQPTILDITAWFDQDFLGTKMTLKPADKSSHSETIVFWPEKDKDGKQQVWYIFEARQDSGTPSPFLGAAKGEIRPGPPLEITGHYWTDRNWETKGMTAGTFVLTRISKQIVP